MTQLSQKWNVDLHLPSILLGNLVLGIHVNVTSTKTIHLYSTADQIHPLTVAEESPSKMQPTTSFRNNLMTVPVLSNSISPTVTDNFINVSCSFREMARKLLREKAQRHVEGTTTGILPPVDVFTKVSRTLYLRYWSDKGRLQTTANAFGLSLKVVSVIIWQVCKVIVIKTLRTEPEVKELVISFYQTGVMPQFLGAISCKHTSK